MQSPAKIRSKTCIDRQTRRENLSSDFDKHDERRQYSPALTVAKIMI